MGYQLIETVTVGSGGAASIEFTGIPQDGVDLGLVLSGRANGSEAGSVMRMRINSDGGSNYTVVRLYGVGSGAYSDEITNNYLYRGFYMPGTESTANTFGSLEIKISNYTSSTGKSISFDSVTENNASGAYQVIASGLWTGTSGVTSIMIEPNSVNDFVQYSTASLYKITAD
jgi:hypothetical protein